MLILLLVVEVLCDRCPEGDFKAATVECSLCWKPDALPLCASCDADMHKGRLSSHQRNPINTARKQPKKRCKKHNKKLILFCAQDEELMCSLCVVCFNLGYEGP